MLRAADVRDESLPRRALAAVPAQRWLGGASARTRLAGRSLTIGCLLWCGGALLLGSPTARAEPVPSLDLRNFRPSEHAAGSLYLEPAPVPERGEWNVGIWASYANGSIRLEDGQGDTVATPLRHQLSVDYTGSVGVSRRLAVIAALPTVPYQEGDEVSEQVAGAEPLPRVAIGDLGLGAKLLIRPPEAAGGFGLAALARVTTPTGDERSYLGEGAVTGELRLLGELRSSGVSLRSTGGARLRGEVGRYLSHEFSHELPWGVGLSLGPQIFARDAEDRWAWDLELHGALAMVPDFAAKAQSPTLAGFSTRYSPGDLSIIGGIEIPVGAAVGIPRVRAVVGLGWAPRLHDEDADGVPDDRDRCPETQEDHDGFQDSDGCLDFDNDRDGVADPEDDCPGSLEDEDGHEDGDGCADPDNDGDGVLDRSDECPDQAGTVSLRGCPVLDADEDGVMDVRDRCPSEREDQDGFEDEDGCPDPDNDGDGVPDGEDRCPMVPGSRSVDPRLHGCQTPDGDGDTFEQEADACPDAAEDFNGQEDADGCPEFAADTPVRPRPEPLVTVDRTGRDPVIRWRVPPRFALVGDRPVVTESSLPTIRALAQMLNQNPTWVLLVGVRPEGVGNAAQRAALAKSLALVNTVRELTHRDEAAETAGWAVVADQPGARVAGVGVIVVPREEDDDQVPMGSTPITPTGSVE